MTRWHDAYSVGQKVEYREHNGWTDAAWTPATVIAKTKSGLPRIRLVASAHEYVIDRKNLIRPLPDAPSPAGQSPGARWAEGLRASVEREQVKRRSPAGVDAHRLRASIELGKSVVDVTPDEREQAKLRSFADGGLRTIELATGLVRDVLANLTPNGRRELHAQLFDAYCPHCFGPAHDKSGRACPCERDE